MAGVDVGGSKILGRVVEPGNERAEIAVTRIDTPRGSEAIAAAIVDVVQQLRGHDEVVRAGGLTRIGVGVPGLVDRQGVLRFAPNLPGVVEFPLRDVLERALGAQVVIDNDAACATWCEYRLGAAVGTSHPVMVTLGTGIGGGLVAEGRLLRGAHGFAGEAGHMQIDPKGPPCPCGRRGCWERFASGSGLGRLARDAAAAGRAERVVALAGGDREAVRGEHVTRAAAEGDAEAQQILREFGWWFAVGVANLVDVLDPDVVVVGGGVAMASELFLDAAREAYEDLVLAPQHRAPVPIVAAAFGADAGAIGAALLAHDELD